MENNINIDEIISILNDSKSVINDLREQLRKDEVMLLKQEKIIADLLEQNNELKRLLGNK